MILRVKEVSSALLCESQMRDEPAVVLPLIRLSAFAAEPASLNNKIFQSEQA